MHFEKFTKTGDGFEIKNFRAEFQWRTADSISFMLCCKPKPNVVQGFGWLDVHATSESGRHIKIRMCLHHDYVRFEDCDSVVETICEQLGLPNDACEATFLSPLKQFSIYTGFPREFVSVGLPYEPDDNPWDDRAGVSPLEIISRETAYGMLLEAFPEFHRRADHEKHFLTLRSIGGEDFLCVSLVFVLVDALQDVLAKEDEPQLRRVLEVLEKLVVFGDDYTRKATLSRLFELIQQNDMLARSLPAFMLSKTREKYAQTVEEMQRWGNKPLDGRDV